MSRQRNFNYIKVVDKEGYQHIVNVDGIEEVYIGGNNDLTRIVCKNGDRIVADGTTLYNHLLQLFELAGDVIDMDEVAAASDNLAKLTSAMREVVGASHPVMVSLQNPDKIIANLKRTADAMRQMEEQLATIDNGSAVQQSLFDPSKLN